MKWDCAPDTGRLTWATGWDSGRGCGSEDEVGCSRVSY